MFLQGNILGVNASKCDHLVCIERLGLYALSASDHLQGREHTIFKLILSSDNNDDGGGQKESDKEKKYWESDKKALNPLVRHAWDWNIISDT